MVPDDCVSQKHSSGPVIGAFRSISAKIIGTATLSQWNWNKMVNPKPYAQNPSKQQVEKPGGA